MTALLVAVALSAAPGCPAALARARALSDADLAGDAIAMVDALEAQGAGGPAEALREAARAATSGAVERSGGRGEARPPVPLDAAPVRGVAGARFRAALLRHCALASQPALPAPTPAHRARASEILDRPEFRAARGDPEALRRRLLDLWQRVLALLETGEAQRYAAFSRAVFLAAAAVAALLGSLALRRRRTRRSGAHAPPPDAAAPPPDARLDRAEDAAARGEAARAVRLALLAALAALERQGALPPGRALTNRELVDRLRGTEPARIDALRTLSRLFDRTVYGRLPAGGAEAAAALQAARTLTERS
jgi:hypothetical protein